MRGKFGAAAPSTGDAVRAAKDAHLMSLDRGAPSATPCDSRTPTATSSDAFSSSPLYQATNSSVAMTSTRTRQLCAGQYILSNRYRVELQTVQTRRRGAQVATMGRARAEKGHFKRCAAAP